MGENPGKVRARLRGDVERGARSRPLLGLGWWRFFVNATCFPGATCGMALWGLRAACGFELLRSRLVQASQICFGLQPFLGDFPTRPLRPKPIAQPAR